MRGVAWLLCVGSLLLGGCDLDPCGKTPDAFVGKAEDFFAQVDRADIPVGDDGWRYYDERFAELVESCYPAHEGALSAEQERLFWRRVSGYYVKRYGRAAAREMLRGAGEGVREQLRRAERWLDERLEE